MELLFRVLGILGLVFLSFGMVGQSEGGMEMDTLSEAERLFQEAEALEEEKKWEKAIGKYDEASMAFLEEKRLDKFEICNNKIVTICLSNEPNTHFEYYQNKLKFCENYFGTDNTQIGFWYYHLGALYYLTTQFDTAKTYVNNAFQIYSASEDLSLYKFKSCQLLAILEMLLDNFKKAETYHQKNFGILTELYNAEIVDEPTYISYQADTRANLGAIKQSKGANLEAIKLYESAITSYLEYEQFNFLALLYNNIGQCYLAMNQYDKAKDYAQKGIYYREKVSAKNSIEFSTHFSLLGHIEVGLLNYEKGIEFMKKGLSINLQTFGEAHLASVNSYSNLGFTYSSMEQLDSAEFYLQKASNLWEEYFPNSDRLKIKTFRHYGSVLTKQNKLDAALIPLNKSLSLAKKTFGERHFEVASTYTFLGDVYKKQGQNEKSLKTYQKSLIANTLEFNNSNVTVFPNVKDFLLLFEGLSTLMAKSIVLQEMWIKENQNLTIVNQFQSSTKLFGLLSDEIVRQYGYQPIQDSDMQNLWKNLAQIAISQNLAFYNAYSKKEYIKDYFFWMEKMKSQELLFISQKAKAVELANIPNTLIEQDQLLSRNIDSLNQLLYTALEARDSVAINTIRNEDLFQANETRDSFIVNLEKNYSNYYQLKYDFTPVSLKKLQQSLNENTLFLELSIVDNEDSKNLFFLALTDQDQHLFKTTQIPNLTQKITTFNALLRSHNLLRADRRRKFIELSHELYQQFIQPIEHLLEGKERLVIVGEGVTHYLPFEALLKSKEDKPWEELDFLIKDHEISYHYSGTLFARAQEQKAEFDNELLAFAPVFSEEGSTLTTLRAGGLLMADTTFRSVEGDNFRPLPYSEKEVNNIKALFPETASVNILLNEAANETNLKTTLERNHRFVHIASHSFANIDYPKFSGIACAPTDTTSQTDDGILYVGEIYNLAVNSDLVVLSSCESGVGKLLGGEGMLGLNRSFVYAGVPNVIFSLWKVYDESTGEMMTEFYKNTLQGNSYSKALRAAKLKMLDNPKTAAPDIWAAFMLVGR